MAVFTDLKEFRSNLVKVEIENRSDYLLNVKYATIKDTKPYKNVPSLRALILCLL